MLPTLAARCSASAAQVQRTDNELYSRLHCALRDNTLRNLSITRQAISACQRLNQVGIHPLFLKGTCRLLSDRVGHRGARYQGDIDLLIGEEELVEAAASLVDDGYRFLQFHPKSGQIVSRYGNVDRALREARHQKHLPSLGKDTDSVVIELHRDALPPRFAKRVPSRVLMAKAQRREFHNAVFLVPSLEDQQVITTLGSFVHDGYAARGQLPLREACDIADGIEQHDIDTDYVRGLCGKHYDVLAGAAARLGLLTLQPRSIIDTRPGARFHSLMAMRHRHPSIRWLLDRNARLHHLAVTAVTNPWRILSYFVTRADT